MTSCTGAGPGLSYVLPTIPVWAGNPAYCTGFKKPTCADRDGQINMQGCNRKTSAVGTGTLLFWSLCRIFI